MREKVKQCGNCRYFKPLYSGEKNPGKIGICTYHKEKKVCLDLCIRYERRHWWHRFIKPKW